MRSARVILATGLLFAVSVSTAQAAPVGGLKQYKVPTANSQPRAIVIGSDGNTWFTEGTDLTGAPAKIGRVTPAGAVTEFTATCNSCLLGDLAQGSAGTLYITSNDPTIQRFGTVTGTFLAPIAMPNSNALGGRLAVHGDAIWVTDFNNDTVWRYNLSTGVFVAVSVVDPSDVAVDASGNAWLTEPGDVNAPGTSNIGRIDAVTGAVTRTATSVAPRGIAIAGDGRVWFTARFTPQAVGRLDPDNGRVAVFPLTNVGPEGIAAAPDGSMWSPSRPLATSPGSARTERHPGQDRQGQ